MVRPCEGARDERTARVVGQREKEREVRREERRAREELLFLLRRAEFLHAADLVQQLRNKVLWEERRDKKK